MTCHCHVPLIKLAIHGLLEKLFKDADIDI
jgi:hypothetical protein